MSMVFNFTGFIYWLRETFDAANFNVEPLVHGDPRSTARTNSKIESGANQLYATAQVVYQKVKDDVWQVYGRDDYRDKVEFDESYYGIVRLLRKEYQFVKVSLHSSIV
jgi:hypothetical protein